MAWTLEFDAAARKQMRKLPKQTGERIIMGLQALAKTDNPRLKGRAMVGGYAGHWRYRFGDYRVIARIEDGRMVVLVIAVAHRREVYR